jgi:predicted molibdopterin-dependent oxidoreductase YjgC
MMNEVEGLLQRVTTGEIDQTSVLQAADEHVSNMDQQQLKTHLQNAANNASQNGQNDIAQQIMSLISQHGSNPQSLKQEAISLITSNPQILQHFEPQFAKGILGRI